MYVQPIDPDYDITTNDYQKDFLDIKELPPLTIVCGQTKSSKSTIINNLLAKKLIFEYQLSNIIFFSITTDGDLTYRPILKFIANNNLDEHGNPVPMNIFDVVDWEMINDIVA